MNAILKFLQALRSLYNQGAIKSIDEAMDFAKREFGEVTEFLDAQIKNVFRKAPEKKKKSEGIMDAEIIETSFKPGKSKYSDKIIEESESQKIARQRTDDLMGKTEESEGIMDIADKMSKKADELKKLVDESKVTEKSILEDALDAATGFQRPLGSKDKSKPFKTHKMEYKRDSEDYRIPGGSSYAEGNLRTAIRQFLRTEAAEGRIKLSEKDKLRIDQYSPMMEDDPIDVFRRYYGEDALEKADDMADELRLGESFKHYEEIFRREMGDLKVKTEGAGQYDQSILDAERIMKEAADEAKNKKILEDFDPTDRDKNATGGRAGYAFGTGLKLLKLFGGSKKLQKAIDDAVDNLNPSGDKKLDADNAIDNMLEEAGIDREAVDQYDIIDAYGKAYDKITKGPKNVFSEVDIELEKKFPGVTEQIEALTKQSSASIKRDTIARRLGLDPFELNEQQKMVLDKYGNKIDDDLLKNILIDDDPQRIAEVTATIDEAFIMQDKGMGPDEILETVKNTTRTKQADGTSEEGLSVMTELLQKAKIKKQKDTDDNKQVRFRKLLASNKFPELNEFFEAQLDEDGEKEQLTMRMFGQAGGPFTTQQLGQRKQQSYLDYLARQGVVGPSAGTGTGTTGTGTTGVSVFTSPTSPAPSTTTTGTSTTTGGTSGGGTTSPGRPAGPGTFLPGSGGGGSTGGGSTGSSGGGTSSGGSNVYTGAGNFPPGMGTNTGGGSAGSSGGSSGLTPNTGNVNVGGGGFGGTGSIVGGGTGSTPSYQSRLDEYKAYVERNKNDPNAVLSPNNFFTQKELLANPEMQDAAYKDVYNPGREFQKQVQAGYDTGDLGSEAANIAANQAATGLKDPSTMSKQELRNEAQQYVEEAKAKWFAENPGATAEDFARGGGRWIDLAEQMVKDKYNEQQSATADDGFGNIPDWKYLDTDKYGKRYRVTPEEWRKIQNEFYGDDPTKKGFDEYFKNRFGADGPTFTSEEYLQKLKDQAATADDGFANANVFTDSQGNKRVTRELYDKERFEFFKNTGKLPPNATQEGYNQGNMLPGYREFYMKNQGDVRDFNKYMEGKYGAQSYLSPDPKSAYKQMGGGADFSQITSLPETTQFARSIQGETNDKNILQKANEFANKHGKSITAASYLLDFVAPGVGKGIRTAQAINKGYNLVTGAVDSAMNDVLTKPTGVGGQVDLNKTLSQGATPEPEYDGNISSIFFKDGGRVNKAVGGPLDLEARRKQSQADFLARQPGAQPAQPQAPTAQPAQPGVAPQPTQPAAPQPFDMSKYQGGTFTGGIEDSRNIALGNLEELGVDISKYRTMSAKKDPNAPTFQGYTNTELMMMSPEQFKQKLGFDSRVQGANAEFEKFLESEFKRTGPMAIGPGGPAGIKTEFKNQDELAQILNRAIPFYMRTARDLGENYTLQEMLAMTDEELAALDDRYDKKMGYGKYRKTPGNIQTSISSDAMKQYNEMQNYMGEIKRQARAAQGAPGNTLNYSTGGRVGFRYGGDDARIKKYMKPSYDDPFSKLSNVDKKRYDAFNRLVLNKGKSMISTDKKKKRNLLTLNEQARAKALQRLNLLKKLYGRG